MSLSDFYRGDQRTIRVTITVEGVPIDITGDKLFVTLKGSRDDLDVDAALQVIAVQPADANSVAGIGFVTLTKDDTDGITPGRYWYDVQWVQTGTSPIIPKTIVSGRVRVKHDITRATT